MVQYNIVEAGLEGNNQYLVLFIPGQRNLIGKRIRIGGKSIAGIGNGDSGAGPVIGLPAIPGWHTVLDVGYISLNGWVYTGVAIAAPAGTPQNGMYDYGGIATNAAGFFRNRTLTAADIYRPIFSTAKNRKALPFSLARVGQNIMSESSAQNK